MYRVSGSPQEIGWPQPAWVLDEQGRVENPEVQLRAIISHNFPVHVPPRRPRARDSMDNVVYCGRRVRVRTRACKQGHRLSVDLPDGTNTQEFISRTGHRMMFNRREGHFVLDKKNDPTGSAAVRRLTECVCQLARPGSVIVSKAPTAKASVRNHRLRKRRLAIRRGLQKLFKRQHY